MTIKRITDTFFHVIGPAGKVVGFATTPELARVKADEFWEALLCQK